MSRVSTPSPVRSRLRGMALCLLATAVLVGGCSSGDDDPDESAPASTTVATEAGGDAPVASTVPDAPELEGEVGVFDDLDVEECTTDTGEVTARGSVRNSAEDAADFVLQVRWVDPDGFGVLARDTVTLEDVAAGATETWDASGSVPDGVEAVCSYSVRRGQLPG